MSEPRSEEVLARLQETRPRRQELYRHLHAHPELSHRESGTAALVVERLRGSGFEVHSGIGGTGVVGILANGEGPRVLLRADMDALPIEETTGLEYASSVIAADADGVDVPVAHACGHDVDVTCLLEAADLMVRAKGAWSGTLVALFQPAEELGDGARAMVEDGLAAIERIVRAECAASVSPREPDLELYDRFPLTVNDARTTATVREAFDAHFGDAATGLPLQSASEDFSDVPTAFGAPYTYWGIGGVDPARYEEAARAGRVDQDIPVNHSPAFTPVIEPTLDVGTRPLVVAALAHLS